MASKSRMTIDKLRFAKLAERRRNLTGRTGCGICGLDSLEAVLRPLPALTPQPTPSLDAVRRALAALPEAQRINRETHSIHAAAWADREGKLLLLREDVGRHNALDKLIGAMAQGGDRSRGGIRPHHQPLQRRDGAEGGDLGMPCLVAISAPTTLALRLAAEAGLSLIALARADSLTIYSEGKPA